MSITINLPHVNHIQLLVTVVLVVAAILASITLELYKRHYENKKSEPDPEAIVKLAKPLVALLLGALSAAFTWLGYLIVVAQSHTAYLASLPFVGKHVFGVIGIAYAIYNLRLNKTYENVAAKLTAWSGKKNVVPAPPTTEEPVAPASDSFVA